MSTYHKGTKQLIEELAKSKPELAVAKNGRMELHLGEKVILLPNKQDLAADIMQIDGESVEARRRLADRLKVHPTLVHKVTHEGYNQLPSKNMLLCCIFLQDQVLSLDEINHALTVMKREDLYTNTYDLEENRRNYLLTQCIVYASSGKACPTVDWLCFANSVICWFNEKPGVAMARLLKEAPDLKAVEKLPDLAKWEEGFWQIGKCRLCDFRNFLIDRYQVAGKRKNKAQVQKILSEEILKIASTDNFRKIFGGERAVAGNRELLIEAAICLGATLEETNRLLREGKHAVLYPRNSVKENKDSDYIYLLQQNRQWAKEESV